MRDTGWVVLGVLVLVICIWCPSWVFWGLLISAFFLLLSRSATSGGEMPSRMIEDAFVSRRCRRRRRRW